MSTDDWAIYQATPLGRDELFDRIMAVFPRHRIRFLQMARGAVWDPPLGFSYVFDQDREDLDSPRQAFIAGKDWQRLIIDFTTRSPAIEFELHIFCGQPPLEMREVVAIRYNDFDSKLAREEPERAENLLSLFQDLGVALDRAAMVCGSELKSEAFSAVDLEKAFTAKISVPVERDENALHTVLFRDDVFQRLKDAPGLAAYARQEIEPGYQVATLLLSPGGGPR
jgi:hypothetical protein